MGLWIALMVLIGVPTLLVISACMGASQTTRAEEARGER
jgi:hypothetical protein